MDMAYVGERQNGDYMCVFASVVGAVNSIVGRRVWTQPDLLVAWRFKGHNAVNFGTVMSVAAEPVRDQIRYQQHVDGSDPVTDDQYLDLIRDCVDHAGVAIISFEHADVGTARRLGAWHMLSLTGRDGEVFAAWDTSGEWRRVTAAELVSQVPYGRTALAVHDRHDMLLVHPLQQ